MLEVRTTAYYIPNRTWGSTNPLDKTRRASCIPTSVLLPTKVWTVLLGAELDVSVL